jgi:hypothetical protein
MIRWLKTGKSAAGSKICKPPTALKDMVEMPLCHTKMCRMDRRCVSGQQIICVIRNVALINQRLHFNEQWSWSFFGGGDDWNRLRSGKENR